MTMTTDNMRDLLRPIVKDASLSIEYGSEDGYSDRAMKWFENADVETLQFVLMGAMQDALKAEVACSTF